VDYYVLNASLTKSKKLFCKHTVETPYNVTFGTGQKVTLKGIWHYRESWLHDMCGSISAEIRKGNWHTQSALFRMTLIYVRSLYSSFNDIICIMQLFIDQVLILRCMAWEETEW